MHQPLQVNFSKLWHQLHNGSVQKQKANESDFTSSLWEKLCYSGSHAVRLATNHSVGYTQDGHTVSWCWLFWSSVLEKSIEFSFHTFIKSWWIDIRHLFSAKRHSHKVKTKFSRWTNIAQRKLWLGKFTQSTWGKFALFVYPSLLIHR